MQPCLFCSGDAGAADHRERCDGRQGRIEAAIEAVPVVLDRCEGRRRRDAAIARVAARADDGFTDRALVALERVARRQARFGADDVWAELSGTARTHDARAMGPVMLAAKRLGLIVATSEFQSTAQPQGHCHPMRIWQSLVYRVAGGGVA